MLEVAGFVVAASMVVGQVDTAPPQQNHLDQLSWLIGRWEGEFILPEGIPDLGKAGSKVNDQSHFKWILDKKFIQLNITNRIDGKISTRGLEVIGWDSKSSKIVHWIFGSTSFHGPGVWRKDGDAWVLEWSGTTSDGTSFSGSSIHREVDEDTYTWKMVDLKRNNKKIPDWPEVTYKRKSGKEKATDR